MKADKKIFFSLLTMQHYLAEFAGELLGVGIQTGEKRCQGFMRMSSRK
jgi:hypothetical protein